MSENDSFHFVLSLIKVLLEALEILPYAAPLCYNFSIKRDVRLDEPLCEDQRAHLVFDKHLMRKHFRHKLVEEGVDCLGEASVGAPQLHVWIAEQPAETRSHPKHLLQ